MNKIYFTSDLHFCHNRGFLYEPRGFASIEQMNAAIVENWNKTVDDNDTVYILGDIMLNDNEEGVRLWNQLNGHKIIILGNHDTDARIELYKQQLNTEVLGHAARIKINGQSFYLSHYPTYTSNLEKSNRLKEHVINLYGHTHQKTNFYNDIPFMYHVGVDSHNCIPVSVDEIIDDIKNKVNECINML